MTMIRWVEGKIFLPVKIVETANQMCEVESNSVRTKSVDRVGGAWVDQLTNTGAANDDDILLLVKGGLFCRGCGRDLSD